MTDAVHVPKDSYWLCRRCNAKFADRSAVRKHMMECRSDARWVVEAASNNSAVATGSWPEVLERSTNDYQVFGDTYAKSEWKSWPPVEVEAGTKVLRELRRRIQEGEDVWTEVDGVVGAEGVRLLVADVPLGPTPDGRLVCDGGAIDGGAQSRCNVCGADVWIAPAHIRLFGGKGDPPTVWCRFCVAKNDERYWHPIVKDMKVYTVQDSLSFDSANKEMLDAYKKHIQGIVVASSNANFAVSDLTEAVKGLRAGSCVKCGSDTKGGARECQRCQRKGWRRRT